MNIKKVQWLNDPEISNKKISYKVTTQEDVILFVPLDEANTDYQNILQWVADGNTIQEAD
tara:strand:+ start:1105 stop:1284 length:180 start_codon:yes stop_codon:yes gene_type:complete